MADTSNGFKSDFKALTGHEPHSWQTRLYKDWFSVGKIPSSVGLPTGTGKTSIMAIWLLALGAGTKLPRRLVWVVDRRVVVDQATKEAESLSTALLVPELRRPCSVLRELSVSGLFHDTPLAVSTLRGQHEDNRDWSEDPSRPAIVIGTVDMVGSRLLFSGYGDGRWRRPFHASLLGMDTLIVLDEAQLSVPFGSLLREIERIQANCSDLGSVPHLSFLPISATLPSGESFRLTDEDTHGDGFLSQILRAPKRLRWHGSLELPISSDTFHSSIVDSATAHEGDNSRIVVYLDRLKDLEKVSAGIREKAPGRVICFTGTMRGYERDQLLGNPQFKRFLSRRDTGMATAYLVSTSAGEVGIDLYADHLVTDLVPVDRMVQRFGRVNRAGDGAANVDIVVGETSPPKFRFGGADEDRSHERWMQHADAITKTGAYLRGLTGVSPTELVEKPAPLEAYTPLPPFPPLRSWHLDNWSLTSLKHFGPPVNSWLRGTDGEPPDVYFVWREEVPILARRDRLDDEDVESMLQEYRLLPREILRTTLDEGRKFLAKLAASRKGSEYPIVVISPEGGLEYRATLTDLLNKQVRIGPYRTVLLPTDVGGLDSEGLLDASVKTPVIDVSATGRNQGLVEMRDDVWRFTTLDGIVMLEGETRNDLIRRAKEKLEFTRHRSFSLRMDSDLASTQEMVYFRKTREPGIQEDEREMLLSDHLEQTALYASDLARKVGLDTPLAEQLTVAAKAHDLGKARAIWQTYARNADLGKLLAKSTDYRRPEILAGYRHELGSVIDITPQSTPLIQHLIAAHHGNGRPHFIDRQHDREHLVESRRIAESTILNFVSLQREFGWWGLAYLESLLKAADGMASP